MKALTGLSALAVLQDATEKLACGRKTKKTYQNLERQGCLKRSREGVSALEKKRLVGVSEATQFDYILLVKAESQITEVAIEKPIKAGNCKLPRRECAWPVRTKCIPTQDAAAFQKEKKRANLAVPASGYIFG